MKREPNGPMIASGAHESLPKDSPGLDLDVSQVQKVRDESRTRLLGFLWREMRPVLYCVAFGISMGVAVLRGIEQKMNEASPELPVSIPLQTTPSLPRQSEQPISVDVDSFVEEILLSCRMPDKKVLFKVAMDPTSTDQEKVREIARLLLTADPKNREMVEKALSNFLKKWLEAQSKKLSDS